jgi:hypothetical protein
MVMQRKDDYETFVGGGGVGRAGSYKYEDWPTFFSGRGASSAFSAELVLYSV